MVKTTCKSNLGHVLFNTVFFYYLIMNKLHVKNPEIQPVIHKQYGFYIYASTYKGQLASNSPQPASPLVILFILLCQTILSTCDSLLWVIQECGFR